ncbi:LacI family DNA-binding transcriptional regulator [Alloyangia pacifica]|uniref:LacI family DNA-binding transcriptional regulator n=1 Tax=Alloyangia pacifica TaxID=311180 RepID=UPI001CFC5894|nr:LacI family DNA-binding transcriptional regulator [Alloyangia pacifica]
MPARITIAELAREARVSVSTIDRILSGRSRVKPATVNHVLATAERIGFHAVGSIRSRREVPGPAKTFGFLLNDSARHFYDVMGRRIAREVAAQTSVDGKAIFSHVTDLDPARTAEALLALGEKCDAIAAVCIDHPRINRAVDELAERGIPVVTMLSDISSPQRRGFVGSNDWQLGRSAGWFVTRLCPQGGKIGLVPGNPRYLCQQSLAASFRSFIAESAQDGFGIVEAAPTEESDARAREVVTQLVQTHPDVAAILVLGGGLEGAAQALGQGGKRPLLIGTELTEHTRAMLTDGGIDMILAHPATEVAREVVQTLVRVLDSGERGAHVQKIMPFQVLIGENC